MAADQTSAALRANPWISISFRPRVEPARGSDLILHSFTLIAHVKVSQGGALLSEQTIKTGYMLPKTEIAVNLLCSLCREAFNTDTLLLSNAYIPPLLLPSVEPPRTTSDPDRPSTRSSPTAGATCCQSHPRTVILENQALTSEDRWLFPWCVRIILLHSVKHNPAVASNEAAGRMNRVLGLSSSTGLDEQDHIRLRPATASCVQEAD